MNIELSRTTTLADGVKRFRIKTDDKERIYIGYFLESFEGMCNYTTPNKNKPYLQVDVVPNYSDQFEEILKFLIDWKL